MIEPVVRAALAEDLGRAGDITSLACIEAGSRLEAAFTAREAGVLVLPGCVWRSPLAPTPEDRFRIGFGRDGLAPALAAWQRFLTRNRSLMRRAG